MTAATGGSRGAIARGLLALGPAAVLFAWTLALASPHFFPMLFQDQLASLIEYRKVLEEGLTLPLLFSQHNEHRLLFPRLAFFADLHWFGGVSALNRAVTAAGMLTGAALFWSLGREARRSWTGALSLAVAMGLMVSMLHWQNLLWGFQLQFVWVFVAGAWGIWLFFQGADPEQLRWGRLAAALAVLTVATFCMANGLIAAWSALGVAIATRRPWRPTAALTLACIALTAIYLNGYHGVGGHSPAELALEKPKEFAYYVAMYLGSLAEPFGSRQAFLFGLAGVGAAGAAGLLVLIGRARRPEELALAAILLFLGLTAAVTGVGRLSFGIIQALSPRYFTPSALFWAALVLFWTLQVLKLPARPLKAGVAVALVAGLVTLAWLQPRLELKAAELARGVRLGSDVLLAGAEDPEAVKGLFPDPAYVYRDLPLLKARRLSIYRGPDAGWIGRAVAQVAPAAPHDACRGFFDLVEPAPQGSGLRVHGWAFDKAAGGPPRRLLIADATGRVVGLASSGGLRPDVAKALRESGATLSGWSGAVPGGAQRPLTAHALLADGRACPVGSK